MIDMLDTEFLFASLASMIKDENSRIVSLGLAPSSDLQSLEKAISYKICEEATKHQDWQKVVDDLSFLHKHLATIKLPGDFKRASEILKGSFYITAEADK